MIMATHTALVRVYHEGTIIQPNGPVDYGGAPDWKYRPTDPIQQAAWREQFADPDRVVGVLADQGVRDEGLEYVSSRSLEAS
ncbi:hypothetical protein ACFOKI_02880 [Sphingomonas qilianensis]|uniref:Uncharacterized protein n=1 Tax=Sphingomonas qilianensis TaxID=1736690 RepID=A0ABU9XVI5_9SPHN